MNGLVATCPVHGDFQAPNIFGGSVILRLENVSTVCPVPGCGLSASFRDGEYELVNSVVRAFHAPGINRESIERFRDIARAVKEGRASKEEVEGQIEEFGSAIYAIWQWSNQNSGGLTLLSIIIGAYLAIMSDFSSEKYAKDLQFSTDQQVQIQQMMLEELRRQRGSARKCESSAHESNQVLQRNRRERRSAVAQARKERNR